MSKIVKLASALPGDEMTNGLDALRDDLLKRPEQVRCAFVWYDVRDLNHKVATHEDVPTIQIRRFEPVGDQDKVPADIKLAVLQLAEERRGMTPLPFDKLEAETSGPVD